MVFMASGSSYSGLVDKLDVDNAVVHLFAELALVVVLFHDASTVQLRKLGRRMPESLPVCWRSIPAGVGRHDGSSRAGLPSVRCCRCRVTGRLSDTDRCRAWSPDRLEPSVPVRIRRALNVESGLNDGLATPLVLFALAVLPPKRGSVNTACCNWPSCLRAWLCSWRSPSAPSPPGR